jgi:hypothetical protein
VPFERLSREDVQKIANRLIQDVLNREGLVRRGVKLVVETGALNLLVEAGYHPQLGARALKRTLERQVTAPIAARLSATPAEQPLIVFINEDQGSIKVDACTLSVIESGAAKLEVPDTAEFLDRIEDVLIRVEELAERLYPAGEILLGDGQSSMMQMQRVNLRQQMRRVSRMLDRADERRVKLDQRKPASSRPRRTAEKRYQRQLAKVNSFTVDDQLFAHDLHHLLTELPAQSESFGDNINDYLVDLLNETSLLNALSSLDGNTAQTLIRIASLDATGRAACLQLRDLYRTLFEKEFNCKVIKSETDVGTHAHMHVATLLLEGPLAALLAPLEAGTHLFVSNSQTYQPVVVTVGPAPPQQFESLPPVLRIYADLAATLDLRTQLLSIGKMGSAELRAFVLAALPAPHEFN